MGRTIRTLGLGEGVVGRERVKKKTNLWEPAGNMGEKFLFQKKKKRGRL